MVEFLHHKYKASDIALRDLKPIFLVDFEVFLATKHNCSMNTIYKFLQLLRMPIDTLCAKMQDDNRRDEDSRALLG